MHLLLLVLLFADRTADDALAAAARIHKTEGARVVVWTSDAWTADERAALTKRLDETVVAVEKLLDRKYDGRIEYFILDGDQPSHVYGGYDHRHGHDKPYVFLSGVKEGESPYIHETAHIIAGEFGTLWLREGVATYAHLALGGGTMRPLVKFGVTDFASLEAAVEKLLSNPAKRAQVEAWMKNPAKAVRLASGPDRGLFYAASAAYVAKIGIGEAMKRYGSAAALPPPHS